MKPLRSTKLGLLNMGARDGIYHDVDGSPFKIGDSVKVVSLADDTADAGFLGQQGRVFSCVRQVLQFGFHDRHEVNRGGAGCEP
jgi:hypothetical protein